MKATKRGAWMLAAAWALAMPAMAGEVADVPEANGYEVVYKFNPITWGTEKYSVDRSKDVTGEPKRIAYFLSLTDKNDKNTWVFVSMDAFTTDVAKLAVPKPRTVAFQQTVDNLEVASNSNRVKTGKIEKGNIEIWGNNYSQPNEKEVPGADAGKFDFGDKMADGGDYGSLQVHNFAEKQTILAFNSFNKPNPVPDVGIGNNPNGQPDWTFTGSSKNFKDAELAILVQY